VLAEQEEGCFNFIATFRLRNLHKNSNNSKIVAELDQERNSASSAAPPEDPRRVANRHQQNTTDRELNRSQNDNLSRGGMDDHGQSLQPPHRLQNSLDPARSNRKVANEQEYRQFPSQENLKSEPASQELWRSYYAN